MDKILKYCKKEVREQIISLKIIERFNEKNAEKTINE